MPKSSRVNQIIRAALADMEQCVDNIQELAVSHGFVGDKADAPAVLQHLANTSIDIERYGKLYANSAVLCFMDSLVQRFGDAAAKAKAKDLARFDYVS